MLASKRILSVIAVVALAIACMAGLASCGGGASEPQNAKDVYDRYQATNHDNYNMNGEIGMTAGVSGMTVDMPISLNFDVNGNSAHGTYSVSIFGAEATGELYGVEQDGKYLTYSKTSTSGSVLGMPASSDDSEWTVTETEESAIAKLTSFSEDMFANAAFEKVDNGYVVTVKGTEAFASLAKTMSESDSEAANALSEIPEEYKGFIDSLELKMEFDKDCNLTKISIPETSTSVAISGQNMDMKISGDIEIGNRGSVAEIVVPEEVVNAATPTGSVDLGSSAESFLPEGSSASAEADKAA